MGLGADPARRRGDGRPARLVTNLKLIDDEGEALNNVEAAVQLHQLVYALPWQTEVRRALDQVAS